jgi:hypothetical protein
MFSVKEGFCYAQGPFDTGFIAFTFRDYENAPKTTRTLPRHQLTRLLCLCIIHSFIHSNLYEQRQLPYA